MSNIKKNHTINMPQMALEALSENWLFKEIGDVHWALICGGLNSNSFDLKNDIGDRLYATFVRIRIDISTNLSFFKENKNLELNGNIKRFGNSMYFSEISMRSAANIIDAELMTTFSIRQGSDNSKLAKSEPHGVVNNIPNLKGLPSFGGDYRLIKKKVKNIIEFNDLTFYLSDDNCIFETTYTLNPFYDLNGVNLLYFAAYPIINDCCEARYFNNIFPHERWEQMYYTKTKDVLYYGNCNINDNIVYKMSELEKLENGSYKIVSTLYRDSDMAIIAKICTVKSQKES